MFATIRAGLTSFTKAKTSKLAPNQRPRVSLYIAVSSDGYIADRNGKVDWLPAINPQNPNQDFGYTNFFANTDSVIMGRKTYDQVLTFGAWPYADKKVVVATKKAGIKPETGDVELSSSGVVDILKDLHAKSFKRLWLIGGASLISSFHNLGYIDDFIITVVPVKLGAGIPLPKPIFDLCTNPSSSVTVYEGGIKQVSWSNASESLTTKHTEYNNMIYNYYSHIHRFMRFKLSEFSDFVAKIDFRDSAQRDKFQKEFEGLLGLLEGHGKYEDDTYHTMLAKKGSDKQEEAEKEHLRQGEQLSEMKGVVANLMAATTPEQQNDLGYSFYLMFTAFQGDYLHHLIREETVLMPELHRLYTNEEVRGVTYGTYNKMTQDQLNGMLSVLFPYVNAYEREVFLRDIKDGAPDKFAAAWDFVAPNLEANERRALAQTFQIADNFADVSYSTYFYDMYRRNRGTAWTVAATATVLTAYAAQQVLSNMRNGPGGP